MWLPLLVSAEVGGHLGKTTGKEATEMKLVTKAPYNGELVKSFPGPAGSFMVLIPFILLHMLLLWFLLSLL